jgi:NAD(P)-dependent dehydrogenase (short-subunit alcohol dehydrogenase family)
MDVPGFALITGAGSGIGKACANAFAKEGCAGLALLDITKEALVDVKKNIEALSLTNPCQILTYEINVTDETEIIRVIQDVAKIFGRIDYVVNAAGIAIKHQGGAAFALTEDWKRVLDVNLTGTFFVLRESAKIMLKQDHIKSSINGRELQRGSIITFGSIQAVIGITLSTAYTASKHAILGLTRSASEDYASQGLRINAICPGYTETPLTTMNPDVKKAMEERVGTAVPMQRMGRPEEIADGVLYLAGGRSSFVTGTALMVDGGYTQR